MGIDDKKAIGTREGYMIRKSLLNPSASFNEKKVQTFESHRQFFSVIILSNPGDRFYVEFDERRIVSPTLCNVKMETWANKATFAWLWAFEEKKVSGPHLEFLRQIGVSLMVRAKKRGTLWNPNIQLKAGYFWSDVIYSLPAFNRYVFSAISDRTPDDNTIDYEELKASFKTGDSFGKIPHWATLTGWLKSGFAINGHTLLESPDSINEEDKTFKCNKIFCRRRD